MKSVFISGATSGIGLTTAQQLDAQGWRVFAAALPDDDATDLINTTSDHLVHLPLDITNAQAVRDAVLKIENHAIENQAIENYTNEGLFAVVNNAGINHPGPIETLPIETIQQQFDVNVFGHLNVIQALLPLLRQTRGRIVNVSSIMGQVAMPTLGAYSMTKHALEALSDVLRLELAPQGITVSLVIMGAVQTPMTHQMADALINAREHLDDDMRQRYATLFDEMQEALTKQGQQAIPPQQVAQAIITALTTNTPKPRYVVDGAAKGLLMLRHLAPDAIRDTILKRALGLT